MHLELDNGLRNRWLARPFWAGFLLPGRRSGQNHSGAEHAVKNDRYAGIIEILERYRREPAKLVEPSLLRFVPADPPIDALHPQPLDPRVPIFLSSYRHRLSHPSSEPIANTL